jgi:hypothetical protein
MPIKSQIRLAQLTGSMVDIKSEVAAYALPATAAAMTGSDLQDVVGALAAAVQRIHGRASNEVFNQTEGRFDTSVFDVNSAGAVTIDGSTINVDGTGAVAIESSGGSISIGADDVN